MKFWFYAMLIAAAGACGPDRESAPDASTTGAPDLGSGSVDAGPAPDTSTDEDASEMNPTGYEVPPRRWPTEQRVTHDADLDLTAVLERDRTIGACQRWEDGDRDEETKLLCGKWMFFYGTFGTVGVPTPILDFAQEWYVDYYGVGFENFGFVPDPFSPDGMPIGLADSTAMLGDVETRAFTCASCHFGKMPDGRYAVGYGNMSLDYGRFLAGLGAPLAMSLDEESANIHPDIRAELLSYVQAAKQDSTYQFAVAEAGLELLGTGQGMGSGITVEDQERLLALESGTMDFLTPPLLDDEVWTVSRILPLWNIPDAEMRAEAEMEHEYLSWTGGSTSLDSFVTGFVEIGGGDLETWPAERLEPLVAYIRTLRVPELTTTLNEEAVERGAEAFVEHGCAECHSGPSGESNRAYGFDEVGTDPEMEKIFNPDDNDELCCGLGSSDPDNYVVTRGVKAPRFVGVDNQSRWLHNGAVPSLGALLCLEARPTDQPVAHSAEGHEFGCDLEEQTRRDLIEYLRSL